jgi:hypothetical protein
VPAEVAASVASRVLAQIGRLEFGQASLRPVGAPEQHHTYHAAQQLTVYAQGGLSATEWTAHHYARGAALVIITALCSRADAAENDADMIDRLEVITDEPSDPIGVVLLAAWCREELSCRNTVVVPALAALASVATRLVRRELAEGKLEGARARSPRGAASWRIEADSAKAWLVARGIEGL